MKKTAHQLAVADSEALDLVMQLMAIPGRSGQEGAVMDFITQQIHDAGVPESALKFDTAHKKTPLAGETGNLIVKLPGQSQIAGKSKQPRRMLSAHVDTVPICVGAKPVRKGKLVESSDPKTGLGADDRAGVAVVLSTLLELQRSEVEHPPLTFLFCIQEEVGLYGARNVSLSQLGKPQLAFNFDGSSPTKLVIGATGGYRMTIDITGVASHAGNKPEEGVSAIAIASLAIADLVDNGWHGLIEKGNKAGTSNVGVIQGGDATNVVTDHVTLRAEARSHDTKFRERIVREIEKAFTKAARRIKNTAGTCGKVTFEGDLDYEAFRLKPTEPAVKAAIAAVKASDLEPELAIANGGLDANWLTHRGVPTVSLGCGQRNIHTVNEQLDIADFQLARRIALKLATS